MVKGFTESLLIIGSGYGYKWQVRRNCGIEIATVSHQTFVSTVLVSVRV